MSNAYLPYQNPAIVDEKLDTEQLVVGLNTVDRERVQVTGAAAAEIARVQNSAIAGTEYGLVTRPIFSLSYNDDSVLCYGNITALEQTSLTDSTPLLVAVVDGAGDQFTTANPFPVTDSPLSTYMTSFSSVAAGQGHCVEVIGSASKTVKVWEVFIEKPTAEATFTLCKQSTADSGGSSSTPTIVPADSTNAAATAVVKAYTVAPTAGSLVGCVWNTVMATTEREDILFGGASTQPVTLRGVAQTLTINTTVAGTNNFTIVHTEE